MEKTAKEGSKVKVEYKGTLEDGTVFDTTEGRAPLEFEVGAKQVIPGFEKEIVGMKKGDEKKITLKPEDAYGQIRDELVTKIPKTVLNSRGIDAKPGMKVKIEPKEGGVARIVTIKEVTDADVVLDMNHPLAGKTLIFEIKIAEVV